MDVRGNENCANQGATAAQAISNTITHPLVTPVALAKLALIYVRQSTETQKTKNWGSGMVQADFTNVARLYGWPDSQIRVLDDRSRSGTTDERPCWREMIALISEGLVGAVFTL